MKAKFLNEPKLAKVDDNFVITLEPLIFQYAGGYISDVTIKAFLDSWRTGYACEQPNFLSKEYLEALVEKYFPHQTVWVVPAGRVTDGPSVPWFLHWLINPNKFYYSGILHDWLRGFFITGNATTDGILRDAAHAEGMGGLKSYLIYLGVRIGTHIGYKCKVPDKNDVCRTYALARGLLKSDLVFDEANFEVRYNIQP